MFILLVPTVLIYLTFCIVHSKQRSTSVLPSSIVRINDLLIYIVTIDEPGEGAGAPPSSHSIYCLLATEFVSFHKLKNNQLISNDTIL